MVRTVTFFLIASLATVLPASSQKPQLVRFVTADGIGIVGAYFPATAADAPAVILLHGLGQTRADWAPLISPLLTNGLSVLALDLRGHGQSTRRMTADGEESVDYLKFRPNDYQTLLLDVNAAYDWLAKHPGHTPRRIGLVGAAIGANVAARYATLNEDLAVLALLSPTINTEGLRTDDVITQIRSIPLRIVVSRYDPLPFESCKHLIELRRAAELATDSRELVICSGFLHGTEMLRRVEDLPATLAQWLAKQLGASPPVAPPAKRPAAK
jgi:pimeloyl-ACP methyl ester carboxylesterase